MTTIKHPPLADADMATFSRLLDAAPDTVVGYHLGGVYVHGWLTTEEAQKIADVLRAADIAKAG